jgi:hypothetical protein
MIADSIVLLVRICSTRRFKARKREWSDDQEMRDLLAGSARKWGNCWTVRGRRGGENDADLRNQNQGVKFYVIPRYF